MAILGANAKSEFLIRSSVATLISGLLSSLDAPGALAWP